ncbi:phage Gp37/Gp68 family protein [Thiosulfatihalobacter marinus]|uniref:phage Gp37/Gp68 family protein n=1 Tax=Thiosulfatihalobacter marinus TaxID=2792481 RepID=UPI0018D6275B|nr:phage Gp37/Gp68 family protein [Thiosulfatihalobacter marinus]
MAKTTKIEWTDFTVNFWEGCQKVGPGCDHCYAEARDIRFTGGSHWGPGAPRRKVKGGVAKLRKINRDAEKFRAENGHWPRVFCSSLSDVFDNAVDPTWRREAFAEIDNAPNTRVQMLTKRVGNVFQMVPPRWIEKGWPQHVGLMITVVNQEEADRDVPKLLDLKGKLGIPWLGLSIEPLLGPVKISPYMATGWDGDIRNAKPAPRLDWIIVGGESGPNARPMHPDWARSLRDQCVAAGVAYFMKQWGEWTPGYADHGNDLEYGLICDAQQYEWPEGYASFRVGKKAAGRLLDGREWNEVPE